MYFENFLGRSRLLVVLGEEKICNLNIPIHKINIHTKFLQNSALGTKVSKIKTQSQELGQS